MASLSYDGGRRWRIQLGADSGRKTIRFTGRPRTEAAPIPEDVARFKDRIERLALAGNDPGADLLKWLQAMPDKLHERLVKAELVEPRNVESAALGPFIDKLIADHPSIKPNTIRNLKATRRFLVDHFGEDRNMRSIRPADAEDWRAWMASEGYGENTIRRHVSRARQYFKAAIRRELIRGANPFTGMAAAVRSDRTRLRFVSDADARKVLETCPNTEWKLLFALSRWGGLRCPSETLALKWEHVDFEHGRIRVPSPKTEHHAGMESRTIPMFPELRPLLETALGEQVLCPDGGEYVIAKHRDSNSNLRTHLHRIIRKAGLEPWIKPFHNLRATRATELHQQFPAHVVNAWLGHAQGVAEEYYLQTTDADFERANGGSEKVAQKAAQHGVKSNAMEGKAESENPVFALQSTPSHYLTTIKCTLQESNLQPSAP